MNQPLLYQNSLSATLDGVNDALLTGVKISPADANSVSLWIAGRQGTKNSYAGMPAPMPEDFEKGVRLFTGEALHSRASIAHILGEEACRVLLLLGVQDPKVKLALEHATSGMMSAIARLRAKEHESKGTFCCGTCTPAYWRNLAAGGLGGDMREIEPGMIFLKAHRIGNGKWRRFPFHWTVSSLVAIGTPAREELRYAAKPLERLARSSDADDVYRRRRRIIAQKAMELAV